MKSNAKKTRRGLDALIGGVLSLTGGGLSLPPDARGGIHWVIKGVLASSERPGYPDPTVPAQTVDRWLEEVSRLGIRSVINMLSHEEMAVYYRHLGQPLVEYYADAGLEVRQVCQEDLGVVVTKRVLLDRVQTAFDAMPKPVIVHCSAGLERSKFAVEAICRTWKLRAKKQLGQDTKLRKSR